MRRLIAIVGAVAFVGAAARVSTLHTHAYTAHDHPEHHHGPAEHDHSRPAKLHDEDDDPEAVHLESCDPGEHAVSLTVMCPPAPRLDAFEDASTNTGNAGRLVPLHVALSVTDVRVHGPPFRIQCPPRAPPSAFPA